MGRSLEQTPPQPHNLRCSQRTHPLDWPKVQGMKKLQQNAWGHGLPQMCYFFCEKTTHKKFGKKSCKNEVWKIPGSLDSILQMGVADAFWWELVKDITGNKQKWAFVSHFGVEPKTTQTLFGLLSDTSALHLSQTLCFLKTGGTSWETYAEWVVVVLQFVNVDSDDDLLVVTRGFDPEEGRKMLKRRRTMTTVLGHQNKTKKKQLHL